jgi:hemolysin activation/secretion protein
MPCAVSRRSAVSLLALSLLAVSAAFAQSPEPPPAKVLGPQSVVEKYDAPVQRPEQLEGLIDFPKLISAPGANDAALILPSVLSFDLEILGTEGTDDGDGFVRILGTSRTGEKRAALYTSLRALLAKYRELPLTLGDVRFVQQDITEAYGKAGFPLMSVVAPPQVVTGGRLRIHVNEFRLASYSVQFGTGNGAYSADAPHWSRAARLDALLQPLLAEPIVSRASLDAKVKRINQNPFRSARVVFEPGTELGQSKAIFQIDEKRPWNVQTGYNNHATKASGVNRYSLGGSFGNVPVEDHQLSWNATLGDRIEDFENYSLIYTVPTFPGHSLVANVNYSDTSSSSIPGINSASTTLQSTLSYDLPILERGSFSWGFGASGILKQFERASLFGGINTGGASFDAVQLSLNHRFNWKEATATNQVVFTSVFSFEGVTSRNTDAAFQAFHNRATGGAQTIHFVLNYARVQQLAPLVAVLEGWSTETQLSWQFTGDSLAGSDNFAIGGPSVLRAYQSSEVSGDEGVYWVQLLNAPPLSGAKLGVVGRVVQQVNLSSFIEAGEGRFKSGDHASLWDYGVQVAVAFKGGFSTNASLGFAGKAFGLTERGDAHCFVSANWRY